MVLGMTQVPRVTKLCALMWDELPPAGGSWRWALALVPEHWGCEMCPSEVLSSFCWFLGIAGMRMGACSAVGR